MTDPTGRQHRHIDHVEHGVNRASNVDAPADVATGFTALRNEDIGTSVHGRTSLAHRADLPADQRARPMRDVDQGRIGIAPEEVDHPDPR